MRLPARTDLLFAGSAGGHLDLLMAVAPAITDGRRPVWVTSRTSRGEALRDARDDMELVPEYGRSPVSALRNVLASARIVARHRPRIVVSSGAGVVVPLCLMARLSGARLVHVETMARVSSPSQTGRLMAKVASRTIVQWPELKTKLPGATVCEPLLLEGIPDGERSPGDGTFVAVGTHEQGFSRLLGIVQRAAAAGVLPGPIFAQTGPSHLDSPLIESTPFLAAHELQSRLRSARVVVCHAGAGIISSALAAGRTPIVVPRRSALMEHVDDHQYQLSRKLAQWGLVVLIEDEITAEHVAAATRSLSLPTELRGGPSIADVLRSELDRVPSL
ncbi:MAG TPA: glycosyltransferase [Solirubrobacteraceae bacterium]|nr:glycosyltransferase [Solirubrobacteraceae bacterium]